MNKKLCSILVISIIALAACGKAEAASFYAATDGIALYIFNVRDTGARASGTYDVLRPSVNGGLFERHYTFALASQSSSKMKIFRNGKICSTWLVSFSPAGTMKLQSEDRSKRYIFRRASERSIKAFISSASEERYAGELKKSITYKPGEVGC